MDMMTAPARILTVSEMRTLVREIMDFLAAPVHSLDDEIRTLWQRYCDACQQVNQQLDWCSQLLDRGEWLEAARQTTLDPRVLECSSILDFEFRKSWEQIGTESGWSRYVPVALSACRRLSEALDNQKQLQPLLKSHVRLALSRAPLAQRLPVMRELARRDTLSTFWRDDVLAMEKLRAPELIREAQKAMAAEDVAGLDRLIDEYRSSPWLMKFPPASRKVMSEAEQAVLRLREIPQLIVRLVDSHLAKDATSGAIAFADWCALWERIRAIPGTTLSELDIDQRTSEALVWVSLLPVPDSAAVPAPMADPSARRRKPAKREVEEVPQTSDATFDDEWEDTGSFELLRVAPARSWFGLRITRRTLVLAVCLVAGVAGIVTALVVTLGSNG